MIFFFFRKDRKIGKEKNGDFPRKVQKRSLFLPVTFAVFLELNNCSGVRIH